MKQQVIFIVFLTIVFTGVYFFLIRPDSPEVAGVEDPQDVLEETECRNVGGRLTYFYNDKYHNFAKCLDKEKGKAFYSRWITTFFVKRNNITSMGTSTIEEITSSRTVEFVESEASVTCSPYLHSPNPPFICQEYLKMFMY